MEKVGFLIDKTHSIFCRILKDEYTRTKFKNIGKDRFPSLLNKLWNTDAIKTKINLVKSFMKTGVFPLNSSSINHSRILQSVSAIPSSSHVLVDRSDNDLVSGSSTSNGLQVLSNTASSFVNSTEIVQARAPSFGLVNEAVPFLDKVLQETMISDNCDDDDDDEEEDDDEDYLPPESISTSSITMTSTGKQERSQQPALSNNNHGKTSSQTNNKRKNVSWDLTNFDDTDEDGNLSIHNVIITKDMFRIDDDIIDSSPPKKSRSQSMDLSTSKSDRPPISQQRKKQKQVCQVVDVSNREGNFAEIIASIYGIFHRK